MQPERLCHEKFNVLLLIKFFFATNLYLFFVHTLNIFLEKNDVKKTAFLHVYILSAVSTYAFWCIREQL
jgi:hypothetical protein